MDPFGSPGSLAPASVRKSSSPTILAWKQQRSGPRLGSGGEKGAVGEDVETLKRRLPLLEYLRQNNWKGSPAGRTGVGGVRPRRGPDTLRPVGPPSVLPSECDLSGSAEHR